MWDELERTGLLKPIKKGDRVLLTAGSRGIESMKDVLKACIVAIKAAGGEPLLFPAMGSHGAATGQGQVEVLKSLGISETSMGVPIYSGWELVAVGHVHGNVPVYADRVALNADHIIIINRIKEHTEYIGDTESGLLKVAVVGLGRQLGAGSMHQLAVNIGYYNAIHAIAEVLFEKLNILGGIALLENQHNRLRRVEAISAREIFDREPELLKESKRYKAKLPFNQLDILLVDEIGKEISGSGLDTKIIGRIMNIYEKECETPRITRIVIRDLSPETHGNAIGIGLADYTTRRAVEKVDHEVMAINCITGVTPEKGRIPIALPTDRAALEAAFKTIGLWSPVSVRVAWVSNTKSLEWLAISEALAQSLHDRTDLEVDGRFFDLPFDESGNLPLMSSFIPSKGV